MKIKAVIAVFVCIFMLFPGNALAAVPGASAQKVVRQGDNIYVSFRYRYQTDMHIIIGRCGPNNMLNIKKIYLDHNPSDEVSPWVTNRSTLFMESCTDWLGPYAVKSLDKSDGGWYRFTGGWHDVDGMPTARTESVSAEVDGSEMKENAVYKGSVRISAVNLIKGYNTIKSDRYVLKETVNMEVFQGKVSVNLSCEALENVLIEKYYGLQVQNSAWKGAVVYGNGICAGVDRYSDPGPWGTKNTVNSFMLVSKNGADRLLCSIDTGVGLGSFENIAADQPSIFTYSYGKTYFNLINGRGKELRLGETVKFRGKYEFN